MSRSCEESIIFILTKDDVLACASGLRISSEQITDDVIESVKKRVSLEFRRWTEVVKATLREAIECPLGLDCYPSCAWWKDGKCTFPKQVNKETKKGEVTCPLKTEPVLMLDWRLEKKGAVNGQERVQTRVDHQQAA